MKIRLFCVFCLLFLTSLLSAQAIPAGDINRDSIVDFNDIELLSQQWLTNVPAEVGILSRWKFDSGSGLTAYDSISAYHGTINNAQWSSDSERGNFLSFDGNDNYVDIPDFNLTGSWTITFWVYCLNDGSDGPVGAMVCGNGNDKNNYMYIAHDTIVRMKNALGQAANWEDDTDFQNKWKFVALVGLDNEIELFIDGISQGKRDISPTFNLYHIATAYTTSTYDFRGYMDDFRIYNQSLSAQQISAIKKTSSSVLDIADLDNSGKIDTADFALVAKDWQKGDSQPLIITEFMADNDNMITDGFGDDRDWIEICNVSDSIVSLDGWYLSDNEDDPTKWKFFTGKTIAPGQHLVVFASNQDDIDYPVTDPLGYMHTNFKLSAGGEFLGLFRPNGTPCSTFSAEYPEQLTNISYGTMADKVESDILVNEQSTAEYFPATSEPDELWNAPNFTSNWTSGSAAMGYDLSGTYDSIISNDIQTQAYNQVTTVYVRIPFTVENINAVEKLILKMKCDDGFVAYINGFEVTRNNVDGQQTPLFDDTGLYQNPAQAVVFEEFDISSFISYLNTGQNNVLAIHLLNQSSSSQNLLLAPELIAQNLHAYDTSKYVFFSGPTPGALNTAGTALLGPIITNNSNFPAQPADSDNLLVSAQVEQTFNPVNASSVQLHYRVMFGSETTLQMYDNGTNGDTFAGDGIYSAIIPASAASSGQMLRWYITASDTAANQSRKPIFASEQGCEEYFGTVIADSGLTSNIDILHWFVEDVDAAETRDGTQSSAYYNGKFYDNIFVRIRGGSTSVFFKKSHKFVFNNENKLKVNNDDPLVKEANYNALYEDMSYMRDVLSMEVLRDSGCPSSMAFPVRIQQNNEFFALTAYVEQVDENFLQRNGLDENGPLYKANLGNTWCDDPQDFDAQNSNSNYVELTELCFGIQLPEYWLIRFAYDNFNIPAMIDYMAATAIMQETDHIHKNYYLYFNRDIEQWYIFPWDRDLSWGYHWHGSGNMSVNYAIDFTGWGPGSENILYRSLFKNPKTNEMLHRRLRTLMDEILQPSTTPLAQRVIENRIDELYNLIKPEADLDRAKWGFCIIDYVSYPEVNIEGGIEEIKNQYLPGRRSFLFGHSDVPSSQPANPVITLGDVEHSPQSGDQDHEYIEILNDNSYAVDISGWKVQGAVDFVLPLGTVICANDHMYISPDVPSYKTRTSAPTGNQGHFVLGNYSGHLSSWGETIELLNQDGIVVDSLTYDAAPTDQQRYLRVTELMYHPIEADPYGDTELEFIELKNTSAQPLLLDGVNFSNGIEYTFIPGQNFILGAGEYVVIVSNQAAFATRYDTADMNIAPGEYSGKLSNSGESVKLNDPLNSTILDFEYSDDWYQLTDGDGYSLTIINPLNSDLNSWSSPASWWVSAAINGSPGTN